MGNRINTVMQPCFFQLAGRAARRRGDRAIKAVGREGATAKRGRTIVERNLAAIDRSLAELRRVEVPARGHERPLDGARPCPTTRRTSSSG